MQARSVRGLVLVLAFAWGVGIACDRHPPVAKRAGSIATKILAPSWVGPAHSGSWYTPSRPGEGFTLQILDNGTALAVWFTYPPAGSNAQQAWIIAQDGAIDGDRIRFGTVFTTRGPRFGSQYDPAQLQVLPWGTLEFRFLDCNRGEFTYAGPAGWGSGTREMARLTALSELECGGKRRVAATGARTLEGLRQRSGQLFDPAHNGEGWQVEELPDGRAQVYWFTYDENGEQAWTIGVAASSGARIDVAENLQPVGTRFGAGFDPAQVTLRPWGRLTLDFSACGAATMSYASTLAAFGSGTLRPVRLTKLAGTSCIDAAPTVPSVGTWSQVTRMPEAHSEIATATVGAKSCVAGGYLGKSAFQCYEPDTDTWTRLASIPGGRDHAMAVTFGGEILVAGGYRFSGDEASNGWRYIEAEDRWESVPALPDGVASAAAMLDGFAYFGDIAGHVTQYNPRTGASRRIPFDGRAQRDHSNLVAFQGELWMLGGRDGGLAENAQVSIYDPASETWRAGPVMRTARAGFAAAANATTLFVAGGERLVPPARVIPQVEAIAAGDAAWTALPALPFAVHGVGGALHGNAFFMLGGSRQAGVARNEGHVQAYRW